MSTFVRPFIFSLILITFLLGFTTRTSAFIPERDFAIFFAMAPANGSSQVEFENTKNLEELLRERYGFTTEVHLNPTYGQIKSVLKDWSERSFEDNAQIFVYFFGEGEIGGTNISNFFYPSDHATTGIKISFLSLKVELSKIKCQNILISMDIKAEDLGAEIGDLSALEPNIEVKNRSRLFVLDTQQSLSAAYLRTLSRYTNYVRWRDMAHELVTVQISSFFGHRGGGFSFERSRDRAASRSLAPSPWNGDSNANPFNSRQNLQEDQAWESTRMANSLRAYEGYLQKYPNGRYRIAAERAIRSFERDNLQRAVPEIPKALTWDWPKITDAKQLTHYPMYLRYYDKDVEESYMDKVFSEPKNPRVSPKNTLPPQFDREFPNVYEDVFLQDMVAPNFLFDGDNPGQSIPVLRSRSLSNQRSLYTSTRPRTTYRTIDPYKQLPYLSYPLAKPSAEIKLTGLFGNERTLGGMYTKILNAFNSNGYELYTYRVNGGYAFVTDIEEYNIRNGASETPYSKRWSIYEVPTYGIQRNIDVSRYNFEWIADRVISTLWPRRSYYRIFTVIVSRDDIYFKGSQNPRTGVQFFPDRNLPNTSLNHLYQGNDLQGFNITILVYDYIRYETNRSRYADLLTSSRFDAIRHLQSAGVYPFLVSSSRNNFLSSRRGSFR